MIILTRLNGEQFALNCDLVERVDAHPNTVVTLVDATKYVVTESLTEVVDRVRDFRAGVLARSTELQHHLAPAPSDARQHHLAPAPSDPVRNPASVASLRLVDNQNEG